jgi:hypothetical protein
MAWRLGRRREEAEAEGETATAAFLRRARKVCWFIQAG